MRLSKRLVSIIPAILAQPALALSCEESFRVELDPQTGSTYSAASLVPGANVATVLSQLRAVATTNGFNVLNEEAAGSLGKLTIQQVRGSRSVPISLTVIERGPASLIVMQTSHNRDSTATSSEMRQSMCGLLSRVATIRVAAATPRNGGQSASNTAPSLPTTQSSAAGRSTITGQAFVKVAALAPKQYPQKGTPVGIIPLTPAVRAWMASAQNGTATGYPAEVRSLISYTLITDERGRFQFTNLPAGEYVLYVDLGYQANVRVWHNFGTNVVTDARSGRVISSEDQVGTSTRSVARSAIVQKTVLVRADGDIVTVELSKSDIFAQGSVFNQR